ncbi:MAG: Uma2 family endonuclease [Blastocatellia bacterium]
MALLTDTEIALDPEKEYEIVNGQPEEKIMGGARHGRIGHRLGRKIGNHTEALDLGEVYGPDTTFLIGTNERLPDVAFISRERMPATGEPEGRWEIVPDLAVEIISPNDVYEKVLTKVLEYLEAGVRQVWLVAPEQQMITLFRSPTELQVFTASQTLTCEDLLPGFRCELRELFRAPGAKQS